MDDIYSLLSMLAAQREPDAFQSNAMADARQHAWNTRPTGPPQYDGRHGTSFYSGPEAASPQPSGDGRFGTSWYSQPAAIQAATMGRGQRGPNGEEVSTGGGTTRVNYDPRYAQYEPQAQRIYNGSPGNFAQIGNQVYPNGLGSEGIGDTSQMDEAGRLDSLRKFMRLKNIPGANQNLFEEQITGMSPIYRQAQAQKMQHEQAQTDKERVDIAVAMQQRALAERKANEGEYESVQKDYAPFAQLQATLGRRKLAAEQGGVDALSYFHPGSTQKVTEFGQEKNISTPGYYAPIDDQTMKRLYFLRSQMGYKDPSFWE